MNQPLCPFCGKEEAEAYRCPPDVMDQLEALAPDSLNEHWRWGHEFAERSNNPPPGTRDQVTQVDLVRLFLICPPCARKYADQLGIHPWLLSIEDDSMRQVLLDEAQEGTALKA